MIKNNSSYTELNNWEPQVRSHLSLVQITGDNLGQFLLDLHLFASPKSASHHRGLIRRDNKGAERSMSIREGDGRSRVDRAEEGGVSWQTCRRWCFPRTGTDSSALGSLESKEAAPGAHSAVCWHSAAWTTCGFLSESCLCPQWHTETEGTWHFLSLWGTGGTGLLPTLPLGKWQQIPLPVTSAESQNPLCMASPMSGGLCAALPYLGLNHPTSSSRK